MLIDVVPAKTILGGQTLHDSAEAQLANKVGELWKVHVQASSALGKTREGLKRIRIHLARRLYDLKGVLSRPGRDGQWSSFLSVQGIPRSTADRLVRSHEQTLAPTGTNCPTGAIETIEVTILRQVRALWPRLSRMLTTPETVELFVSQLKRAADEAFGQGAGDVSSAQAPLVAQPYGKTVVGDGVLLGSTPTASSESPMDHERQPLEVEQHPDTEPVAESPVSSAAHASLPRSSASLRVPSKGIAPIHSRLFMMRARRRTMRTANAACGQGY